ncbi:hypothetical protein [Methyloversatilis sp.]|uniref:hypothetical protein n=1 Tax=Methyloversatilis sp. TaxID=2569862 RepID=UPI0027333DAE|nr:hypothetical protein [Methyloversatilis sp.]MDP3457046.1 hypothetical protein [Methyloversatilis sp.]
MNYKQLKHWIYTVALGALLLSVAGFVITLLIPLQKFDFQGASGVGALLPSFAGILIAAFALYAYVKLEDATYVRAKEILVQRYELVAHSRSVTFHLQIIQNAWGEFHSKRKDVLMQQLEEEGQILLNEGKAILKKDVLDKEKEQKVIDQEASKYAFDYVKDSLTAILSQLEPEISRLSMALTPVVLQAATSNKEISSTKWLKALNSVHYSLYVMRNNHRFMDNAFVNIYAGTEVVIKILAHKEFSKIDYIYNLIEAMVSSEQTKVPEDLEQFVAAGRDAVFSEFGTPTALGGKGAK